MTKNGGTMKKTGNRETALILLGIFIVGFFVFFTKISIKVYGKKAVWRKLRKQGIMTNSMK